MMGGTLRAPGISMTPIDWGLLVLLSFLWGGSFNLIQLALREMPPITLVCLRTTSHINHFRQCHHCWRFSA